MQCVPCVNPTLLTALKQAEIAHDSDSDAIIDHLGDCARCRQVYESLPICDAAGWLLGNRPPSNSSTMALQRTARSPRAEALSELPPIICEQTQYEWLGKLGHGGNGDVWLVRDPIERALQAVKIVRVPQSTHSSADRRALRDGLPLTIPRHPNVVDVYGVLRVGSFKLFPMELVLGEDVEHLATRHGGQLPVSDTCEIIHQALHGVEHAHRHQLLHRDLKPANLMLTLAGSVKVLDFGLGKALADGRDGELTHSHAANVGTRSYMAPEQALDLKSADERSDLFSLGCSLFRLLAGFPPPEMPPAAGGVDRCQKSLEDVRGRLLAARKDVPRELAAVVSTMMAPDPRRRFPSARDVADALRTFCRSDRVSGVAAEPINNLRQTSLAETASSVSLETPRPATLKRPSADRGTQGIPHAPPPGSERRARRRWFWCAFLLGGVLFAAAMLLRIQTRAGWIEIETERPDIVVAVNDNLVDRTEIRVSRRGGRHLLTIEAEAGKKTVRITKDGFAAISRDVTIEQGKGTPIAVRLIPLERPAANPTPVATVPPAKRPADRMATVVEANGTRWRSVKRAGEEPELVVSNGNGEQWILFGDPAWTDYDFSFEARHDGWPSGITAVFRAESDEDFQHFGVGWLDLQTDLLEYSERGDHYRRFEVNGQPIRKKRPRMESGRWYKVRVSVRGEKAVCLCDDVTIFELDANHYPRGRVGVRTFRRWEGTSRFRKFVVMSADGKSVLWEGIPEIPGE